MKKLTSILLLLLFVWTVQAQTAREEIRANRYLSANNYYAYPTPTAKQTAAPKGYEPFYISTYMRHGSRYLIDPNDYRFPKQTLLKADSLNKLTATGKNTLDIVLRMADMAEGRLGELTSVGDANTEELQSVCILISHRYLLMEQKWMPVPQLSSGVYYP